MKKIISFLPAICILCLPLTSFASVLVTGWGTAAPQPFTMTSVDGSFSQTTSSAAWSGVGFGQLLRGSFSIVDVTTEGNPPLQLELSMFFNTVYNGTIDLRLRSSPGNQWGYSVAVPSLSGSQTLIFVRNAALDLGTPVGTAISSVQLNADDPNFTLDTLTAIPEPATWALLGVAVVGGVLMIRRRRASVVS